MQTSRQVGRRQRTTRVVVRRPAVRRTAVLVQSAVFRLVCRLPSAHARSVTEPKASVAFPPLDRSSSLVYPRRESKSSARIERFSDPHHVPEKIYVTYNYLPDDRARAQQMFLEAGMLDVVVDPALLSGFQKLCIPNEETISKLGLAARLQALPAPTVHRVLEPTARELSAARLLHMFVWIHHSHEGHPRPGVTYDAVRRLRLVR